MQFCDISVNGIDNLGGCAADRFKGAFQFGKLAPAAPPGDVPKGIVRRVKPVVLADGISDAFRFDFAGAPVNAGLLVLWGVKVNVGLSNVGFSNVGKSDTGGVCGCSKIT